MAFTGAPVFQKVSDRVMRVTGLSLAAGAAGVFGLNGDAGAEIELPADYKPVAYADVDLAESVEVAVHKAATSAAALDLIVAKAPGPPFRVTVTNDDGVNATGALEFYFRFH